MEEKRSKFIGCLTGVAVGDSLGARFEGAAGVCDGVADLSPRYTDDTAMTIGVAESLIEHRTFHYWHMTGRLLKLHESEPWRRYGATLTRVFRMMRHGRLGFGMLDREFFPEGSWGNGAAMRVAPVGLLYHDDPRTLRDIAYHCASITHSHELALEGAVLQACSVALAVLTGPREINPAEYLAALRLITRSPPYQEKMKLILQLLKENCGKQDVIDRLGNGPAAIDSVPTAIYSFLANPDFKSALLYAVSLGGDADSIGSMTGAIAGARYGIEGIPSQWRETVENRVYLEQLGSSLWEVRQGMVRQTASEEEKREK
jgi:poly(ADP-ribose) glycohydrolase ARH3